MSALSADHGRGRSLAELKHFAKLEDVPKGSNKKTAIKAWVRSGGELLHQAAVKQDEGDYETAFIYLRKAAK